MSLTPRRHAHGLRRHGLQVAFRPSTPDLRYDSSMRRGLLIPLATAALFAALVTTALARSSPDRLGAVGREGGTFRVSVWSQLFDSVGPARAGPELIG
jgi:hypothetical protein